MAGLEALSLRAAGHRLPELISLDQQCDKCALHPSMLCSGTRLIFDDTTKGLSYGTCPRSNYVGNKFLERLLVLGFSLEDAQHAVTLKSATSQHDPLPQQGIELVKCTKTALLERLVPDLLSGTEIPFINPSIFYASLQSTGMDMAAAISNFVEGCPAFVIGLTVEESRYLYMGAASATLQKYMRVEEPPILEVCKALALRQAHQFVLIHQPDGSVYRLNDESIWGLRLEYSHSLLTKRLVEGAHGRSL